jgi:hypothetical protein
MMKSFSKTFPAVTLFARLRFCRVWPLRGFILGDPKCCSRQVETRRRSTPAPYQRKFWVLPDNPVMRRSLSFAKAIALVGACIGISTAANACSYSDPQVVGEYGGHTFYRGLIVQENLETGKKLAANQAVSVGNIAECVQVCLNDANCTGVSYRLTSHGQCLTFAGFDFDTNTNMTLIIHFSAVMRYSSALVRQYYQGPKCR